MRSLLLPLVLLVACGGPAGEPPAQPCAGPNAGNWHSATGSASLLLTPDCHYIYAVNGNCASEGTYAAPLGSSGSAFVSIQSSSGAACLSVGDHACPYSASGASLSLNCGAGPSDFTR